jgi:hypothetical protein
MWWPPKGSIARSGAAKAPGFEDAQGYVCISIIDSGVGIPDELVICNLQAFLHQNPREATRPDYPIHGIVRLYNGGINPRKQARSRFKPSTSFSSRAGHGARPE